MKIVFDVDGTLALDDGRDYESFREAPAMWILRALWHAGGHTLVVVTGREQCPPELLTWVDKAICRDWPVPADPAGYYPQYFAWKVRTIVAIGADLAIDDDQQVWVPAAAYHGFRREVDRQ